MAWLIWTEPDPEMIKAKGVWGIQRERMTERIWLMLFFLFPILWEESEMGWEGVLSIERPDGLVFERAQRREGVSLQNSPTHTPIKSIRVVRDSKKTGNHYKKWSFFCQLLNTECTPWSSLSFVAPAPCLATPFSFSFCLSPRLPAFESDALAPRPGEEAGFFKAQLDSLLACCRGSFSGFYSQTAGANLKETPSTSPLKHLSLPFFLPLLQQRWLAKRDIYWSTAAFHETHSTHLISTPTQTCTFKHLLSNEWNHRSQSRKLGTTNLVTFHGVVCGWRHYCFRKGFL